MMKPICRANIVTSIITNNGATTALRTLRSVASTLTNTQQQISSGLRVSQAKDDSAYWSIATTMRSNAKALDTISDNIGVAKSVLDTTYAGMDAVREQMVSIRDLIITAQGLPAPVTDGYSNWTEYQPDEVYDASMVAKVDADIFQHWQQINSIAQSSSFAGVNLLVNDASAPDLPGSKTDFSTGYVNGQVQTISIDRKDTTMINFGRKMDNLWGAPGSENMGYLDGTLWSANIIFPITYVDSGTVKMNENQYTLRNSEVRIAFNGFDRGYYYNALVGQMEERISAITQGMSVVGSAQKRVDIQDDFTSKLRDNITRGIGRLVDTNMESASARLTALQTQQQLAVQSLNIANGASSNILSLFQP